MCLLSNEHDMKMEKLCVYVCGVYVLDFVCWVGLLNCLTTCSLPSPHKLVPLSPMLIQR